MPTSYLPLTEPLNRLSPQEREDILRSLPKSSHGKRENIYAPGKGERLFLVEKGKITLYRLSPQREREDVQVIGPGVIFGHMPLLGLAMKETYAEVLEEATLSTLDRAALERLLVERPRFAVSLLESIGERLLEAEASLEVAFRKVSSRLAHLILRLAEQQGPTIQGFTHQQLADRIGTYRETTTQTLNNFKRRGFIEIGRKRLKVLDFEGLKGIAEE